MASGHWGVNEPAKGLLRSDGRGGKRDHERRAGLEYDLPPRSMLYFTVASGYRPGGLSAFNPVTNAPNSFQSEVTSSFEFGSKNRFFDGRLQVNADIFHYKQSNYQDLDKYSGFIPPEGGDPCANGEKEGRARGHWVIDCCSRPHSPNFSGTLGYTRTLLRLDSGAAVSLGGEAFYTTGYWVNPVEDATQYGWQSDYWLGNLKANFTSADDRWSVNLFVRNIGNYAVKQSVLPAQSIGDPRTYGVTVGIKW